MAFYEAKEKNALESLLGCFYWKKFPKEGCDLSSFGRIRESNYIAIRNRSQHNCERIKAARQGPLTSWLPHRANAPVPLPKVLVH
jgi:hypothetical protein